MQSDRVLIIGGGAAGLAAAVSAARLGARVTVLERMDRPGKKLLATGNGRCNLLNSGEPRYPGGEGFARAVLRQADAARVAAFFQSLGLSLREEEEGRVYPASGQAAAVLDVLRLGCARHKVEILCGQAVTALKRSGEGWTAITAQGRQDASRVIVAGGGKAAPNLGSDGSAYALLAGQGHRLIAPRPALTPLKTQTEPIRGLSGIRVKARLWLTGGCASLPMEDGEILFTDYGVSGVAVLQLSREAEGSVLHLSLLPAMNLDADAAARELPLRAALFDTAPLEQFFCGWLPSRLGMAILRRAGIGPLSRPCSSLTPAELQAVHALLCDFPLEVTGALGFDSAQVTAGGIDPAGFDPATMASRLAPGLYAAGEVLHVDGACGGFNLLFAWASGILAGESAGRNGGR